MAAPAYTTELVNTKKQLAEWISITRAAKRICFDTETTSTDAMTAKLVGIALAAHADGVYRGSYIPFGHTTGEKQLSAEYVLDAVQPILAHPKKVAHHAVYDLVVAERHGLEIEPSTVDDTMLLSYALNAGSTGHGFDELCWNAWEHRTIQFNDVVHEDSKFIPMETFAEVQVRHAAHYAGEDASLTLALWYELWQQIKDAGLAHVYTGIDKPLLDPLVAMKLNGIAISRKKFAKINAICVEARDKALAKFQKQVPGVNIASPKQLGEYIYGAEGLGMEVLVKTKTGNPSTGAEALEVMADLHPSLGAVAEYKKYDKLVGTYTDKLPRMIHPETGRVHCHLGLTSTDTARLSSSDPNLQNIPVRTKEGGMIREAFVASKGFQILGADYSQIELRILAHITQDRSLLKAFRADKDIHSATAEIVFGLTEAQCSPADWTQKRRYAKTINFGLIYGMTAHGLAKQLKISEDEAQDFIDTYFAKLPGVMTWAERAQSDGAQDRFVHTLFGRKLYLTQMHGRRWDGYAGRQGMNFPIQGCAADLIRLAMAKVPKALAKNGLDAVMLLQVHDELLFEVRDEVAEEARVLVKKTMETAADGLIEWSIPIIVDAKLGPNWGKAH